MMDFKQAFKKLNADKGFIKWKKAHEKDYLIYGFYIVGEDVKQEWQIGFYNKKEDMITAFCINEVISQNPETQAYRQSDTIDELEVTRIVISCDQAISKSDALQKSKYPGHEPLKKIIVIQKLPIGQVWNITYITKSFKTLNIKVDSESGKVLKDELLSVFKVES